MNFSIFPETFSLKFFLLLAILIVSLNINAQKVDSIYIDLYTDSLKKGTYNYINIAEKLPNGRFIPLDTTDIIFTASGGNFSGNSLWIGPDFTKEKVFIKVTLRSNPAMYKEFTVFIKKKPDDEKLKTLDDLMNEKKPGSKPKRKTR